MERLCINCKHRFVLHNGYQRCPDCRARMGVKKLVDMDAQDYNRQRGLTNRLRDGFRIMNANEDEYGREYSG